MAGICGFKKVENVDVRNGLHSFIWPAGAIKKKEGLKMPGCSYGKNHSNWAKFLGNLVCLTRFVFIFSKTDLYVVRG